MRIKFIKKFPVLKVTNVIVGGALLLLLGTFIIWRVSVYLSPVQKQTGNGAVVILKSSDHYYDGTTKTILPNTITDDGIIPSYEPLSTATPLATAGGKVLMPRFQGSVSYH